MQEVYLPSPQGPGLYQLLPQDAHWGVNCRQSGELEEKGRVGGTIAAFPQKGGVAQ